VSKRHKVKDGNEIKGKEVLLQATPVPLWHVEWGLMRQTGVKANP
jgi:hypothetical protein